METEKLGVGDFSLSAAVADVTILFCFVTVRAGGGGGVERLISGVSTFVIFSASTSSSFAVTGTTSGGGGGGVVFFAVFVSIVFGTGDGFSATHVESDNFCSTLGGGRGGGGGGILPLEAIDCGNNCNNTIV